MTGPTVVERFHDVLARGALPDLASIFTADAVMITMWDADDGQPVAHQGCQAIIDYFSAALPVFGPFSFDEVRVHEAGTTVVGEWRSTAEVLANGAQYRNRFVGVFQLDSVGMAIEYRQYRDPNAFGRVAPASSGT